MRRLWQFSILGILILFGMGQTGCGVLGSHGGAKSKIHTPDPISVINSNRNHFHSFVATVPKPAQPIVQYPSFGLDTIGPMVLALNERLAELGYLPLTVDVGTAPAISLFNLDSPPQVTFQWRFGNIPPELSAQWSAERYTQMTRAAVIAVEHVNGLAIDGIVGEAVWKAILDVNAVKSPRPYTFVRVTETPAPEELRVWQDGLWVYQSIANTGEPGAPSTDGTFTVFKRFASQTMKGKNPDGTKYADPGVPYVNYYHGSEAIHGFERAAYGFPQSVGCVELPVNNAKVVWSLIDYGTLVTVEGQYAGTKTTKTAATDNHNASVGETENGRHTTAKDAGQSATKNAGQYVRQNTMKNIE
jgi:peptidoglycan hydrolase-like protein with peptidoglycan-binding domain